MWNFIGSLFVLGFELIGMYFIACSLYLIGYESLTTLDCQRIGADSGKCQLNQTNLLGGTRSRNIPLESLKGAELVDTSDFVWGGGTNNNKPKEVNIVIGEDRINFRSHVIYLYYWLFTDLKIALKGDNSTYYEREVLPKKMAEEELQKPVNKINDFVNNKELPVLSITQDDRLVVSFWVVFLFLVFLGFLGELSDAKKSVSKIKSDGSDSDISEIKEAIRSISQEVRNINSKIK